MNLSWQWQRAIGQDQLPHHIPNIPLAKANSRGQTLSQGSGSQGGVLQGPSLKPLGRFAAGSPYATYGISHFPSRFSIMCRDWVERAPSLTACSQAPHMPLHPRPLSLKRRGGHVTGAIYSINCSITPKMTPAIRHGISGRAAVTPASVTPSVV